MYVCARVNTWACVFHQMLPKSSALLLYCPTNDTCGLVYFLQTKSRRAPSAVSGGRGCSTNSLRTCDADLGRPLRGAVQHALLDLLHLGYMSSLDDGEHFLNELKDLWFVPLTDLHTVFKNHDNVLGSVLCAVFGALLSCSWWR